MAPKDFYTTKLIIEIEVTHQWDTSRVMLMIADLLDVPAVHNVNVISAESNYKLHGKLEKMLNLDIKNLPK